jgi:predicted RNA-binding protein with RPS1 domain
VYAGQKLKGKVRNVEDFGAFVDVGAGTKTKLKIMMTKIGMARLWRFRRRRCWYKK